MQAVKTCARIVITIGTVAIVCAGSKNRALTVNRSYEIAINSDSTKSVL